MNEATEIKEQAPAQRWYSRDMDPATEAQALYDHFNGKVPVEGGATARLFPFFEGRPHIHPNDWKPILELSLKIQHNAAIQRYRAQN